MSYIYDLVNEKIENFRTRNPFDICDYCGIYLKFTNACTGKTNLTPEDDEMLTDYLWPIVREIIKTAIENKQNLVIEGGYIPFGWRKDFSDNYLKEIQFYCLAMTKNYIVNHFEEIKKYANVVENRIDDSDCTIERLICENEFNINMCKQYRLDCILSDKSYNNKIDL